MSGKCDALSESERGRGGPKVRRGDFQKPADFKDFLVPVLVPVCTVIWCDLVQFDAKLEDFQVKQKERFMLRLVSPCGTVQNAEKWTQNPLSLGCFFGGSSLSISMRNLLR
jgi:hypothetical protein